MPEHCLFDHIHNQTQCMNFDDWNRTAGEACGERGMRVKSFAMLLPCGIDVFSGVEFVCCPKKTNADKKGSRSVPPFAEGLTSPIILTVACCSSFPRYQSYLTHNCTGSWKRGLPRLRLTYLMKSPF